MHKKTQRARQGLNRKKICRSKNDMQKIKRTNRVKGKNLILKLWTGLNGSPGSRTGNNTAKYELENKQVQD
jgi:hypothetical protein